MSEQLVQLRYEKQRVSPKFKPDAGPITGSCFLIPPFPKKHAFGFPGYVENTVFPDGPVIFALCCYMGILA
jgi:hypothetical protein